MKCRITRNPQGEVDFVQAPNGQNSNLYAEALNHTNDPEAALNIWSLAYSDQFIEINGDWQSRDQMINNLPSSGDNVNVNVASRTQGFFSDVVQGNDAKFKPSKKFVPDLPYTDKETEFNRIYSSQVGQFDEHIATSIPTFRETQVKVGSAVTSLLAPSPKAATSDLVEIKDRYLLKEGLPMVQPKYSRVDPALFKEISDMHAEVVDDRQNAVMRESYLVFMDETMAQYKALVAAGYKIEPWLGEGEPYGVDSNAVRKDVIENKHLYYLRSRSATGEFNENESAENYLPFTSTGIELNGDDVLFNDLFRAVHDIFGHVLAHNTFSTQGELNAYKTHAPMYSKKAQKALFLETVVYNAWFAQNRNYAPRKIYNIPDSLIKRVNQDPVVYDIGGSEGTFVKSISESSNGSISSINLEPNQEMVDSHNANPVENSKAIKEAFLNGFDGIKAHRPTQKADVVHESMVFQFISPNRSEFLDEVVDNYLKEDGLFLTEEKLRNANDEVYQANERFKNENHKSKYYTQAQQALKSENILVGMQENQAYEHEYLSDLRERFKYVEVYWSSGNFKGIAASNDQATISKFMKNLGGPIRSQYSNIPVESAPAINIPLDENGEPTLGTVLDFIKSVDNSDRSLTKKDLDDLRNNLLDLPFNSIQELSTNLNSTFYQDGEFVVTRARLNASNMYTPLEVQSILSSPEVQARIKQLIDRISGEVVFKDQNLDEINSLIDTTFFVEDLLISDTSQIVGIGKFSKLNPNEVEKSLAQVLAGNFTVEAMDSAMGQVPFPALQEKYKTDKDFAQSIFDRYSRMKNIPVLDPNTMEPRVTNDVLSILEQTAVIQPVPNGIVNDIDFMLEIPFDVWEESGNEIVQALEVLETKAIDYGIDIVGLAEMYEEANQTSIDNFLRTLRTAVLQLNSAQATPESLANLAQAQIDLFGLDQEPLTTTIDLDSASERDKNLVQLDTTQDELTLFSRFGLIKVRGNIYQRINPVNDITQAYEMLYELVVFNSRLVPEEALYPTAFDTNNRLNLTKLKNRDNREDIINDMQRYVRTRMKELVVGTPNYSAQVAERLLIHKLAFSHPITRSTPTVNMEQELSKHAFFNGDYEYLTTSFISDFYGFRTQEKQADSELYNNVLRHFTVDNTGISLINSDPYTIQGIRLFSQQNQLFNALRNYSILSRKPELQGLYEFKDEQTLITDKFLRDFYANNPANLEVFTGNYQISETGLDLVALNVQNSYLRVPEGVYEKINEFRNVSFYKRLPRLGNTLFKQYKTNFSVNTRVDFAQAEDMIQNLSEAVSVRNLITSKELESINEQLEDCG